MWQSDSLPLCDVQAPFWSEMAVYVVGGRFILDD